MPLLVFSLSIVLMTRSGWWLTIPGLGPLRSSIMIPTTRSFLLSMRHSRCGITTLRALLLQLMWSLTTKTWSTLQLPSSWPGSKPAGRNSSPSSIWLFVSALESLVWSLIPSLDAGMSIQKRGIRITLTSILTVSDWSSCRNSLLRPSELLIMQLRSSGLVSCLT